MSPHMICSICNQFVRDAIVITKCFHAFCRNCISTKHIDQNLKDCVICSVDLGSDPVDKLREKAAIGKVAAPQELVFPNSKHEKVAGFKKDKRQPVIEILEKIAQNLSSGRVKSSTHKNMFLKKSTSTFQHDNVTKDDERKGNHSQLLNSSNPESSQDMVPNDISIDNIELHKQNHVRWEPLYSVANIANQELLPNSTMQEHVVMPIPADLSMNDPHAPKCHVENSSYRTKADGVQNITAPSQSYSVKTRRTRSNNKRAKRSQDVNVLA